MFWERTGEGWTWRTMFGPVPLPLAWPVYVSHAEAEAFLRWRGDRLPTEAEYHRAAFGTPAASERRFPWGDEPPDADARQLRQRPLRPGGRWARIPQASAPGASTTSSAMAGSGPPRRLRRFPALRPMASYPEYSADFFDGKHLVMKGASPATPVATIRRSFRNWFRPHYPYVYATFRGVRS